MSKIAMVTGAGTGVGRRVSEVLSKDGIIAVSYTHLTLPTMDSV